GEVAEVTGRILEALDARGLTPGL
ncbi:MAG: hypothetical protein RLZZ590_1060, partial [Actinomycetota bacterium]